MRVCFAVCLVLTVFVAVASAQSQREMNETACNAARKADAALNAVYQGILKNSKDDKVFVKKLRIAQRAWVAFRDAELEARYPEEEKTTAYGTMYTLCYCTALADLTRQRTEQLMPWRDGVPEGDGCTGSRPVR